MKMDTMMCGSRELEFAIFCIENIASRLHVNAQKVYVALNEQTNILKDYIIPEYEVLHTQSKYTKQLAFMHYKIIWMSYAEGVQLNSKDEKIYYLPEKND